ncbi:MAG: EAL domain-containing protein [Burkholderiales bacterium]|nr:EAL domain-containing protein [Burkholderiales bacterium]
MTDRRRTILIVDDDADARLVMRAALRKVGFDVRMAEGGEDALKQFRAEPCDLVMLDVDMPDLSGHEVCAILRSEAGPLLPIVMVTGMDDVTSVETAYMHGATDFISKPVNWPLLGHRVRYLFRGLQALLDLRAAEARNAAILNAIPDLLFEVDIDGRYIDYRAPDTGLLAAPADDFLGKTVADILPPAAAEVCMAALRSAHERGSSSGAQFELPLKQGSTWFELSVSTKAVPAGEKPRFIVLSRDVTERKVAEAGIARLAYFDSLTGLPNRLSFLERVDREVRRAEKRGEKLAVLFMDLDGFKNINDSMGHAAGDLILQWAAERLRDGLRPSDILSRPTLLGDEGRVDEVDLARLGGDEFTALVLDIEGPEEAAAVASRIGALMRRPFVLEDREVTLTTSIGIALYPHDGGNAATLLKHADTAMYHAKNSGRDNAKLYSASLTKVVLDRMDLDASLRSALEREEFHLVYQPQVDTTSGRICTIEALIRWAHPTRGLVSPLEFIPLAEQNGLIERIGQWVLRTACSDAVRWNLGGSPLKIAVNLSPLQFNNPDLPKLVAGALAESGLAPALLELEVTEGALMENTAATRSALQALRNHGINIALDDFGTGFSSLAYLTRMPIGNIKIDKCFVTDLLDGGESEAIVRAVLAMAGSLGMRVTAEGVETLEQARALKAMACDGLQGYYFSRPVVAERIPALLMRRWAFGDADVLEPAVTMSGATQASAAVRWDGQSHRR